MNYPSLGQFMKSTHGPAQRLMVMALAKLTTTGEYWNKTPEDVWDDLIAAAQEVYDDEVSEFLERMGYHNIEVDLETNQLSADFWVLPIYRDFKRRSFDGWGTPPEERRLVRYRRSSNGIYQEVWEEPNGHIFYGFYMPEGFVPPEGMSEDQ
jgi:hypothetical protein